MGGRNLPIHSAKDGIMYILSQGFIDVDLTGYIEGKDFAVTDLTRINRHRGWY